MRKDQQERDFEMLKMCCFSLLPWIDDSESGASRIRDSPAYYMILLEGGRSGTMTTSGSREMSKHHAM
jgi:hypothetical protein